MTLPALSSLRASFPNAKITWLVRSNFAPLLKDNPGLDDIILFDRKLLGKWWCCPKAFHELKKFIKNLRQHKFDLTIDFQGLFRTALFAWLSGCKKRFGPKDAREFASLFYNHKIAHNTDSIHVVDKFLDLVSATGASKIISEYNLSPTPQATEYIMKLLKKNNIILGKYVIFIPGSAHDSKCWPTEKFAELANQIVSEYSVSIIVAGTTDEKPLAEKIIAGSSTPVLDLTGRTNIPQLIALLKNASLVISNDTGPGHIAVALDTNVVMIIGPTNPARIKPYKKTNSIAAIDPDTRGNIINSTDPKHCIEAITVGQVFENAEIHLKQNYTD